MKEGCHSMKVILAAVVVLACAGCGATPQQAAVVTSNRDVQVDFLFEKDGYCMYRFDDGHTVHFLIPCDSSKRVAVVIDAPCIHVGKTCQTVEDAHVSR